MKNDIFKAIKLHHEAKRAEATANLNVLLNNPVGVGDHPVVEEAIKWLDQLDNADSHLQTLDAYSSDIKLKGKIWIFENY